MGLIAHYLFNGDIKDSTCNTNMISSGVAWDTSAKVTYQCLLSNQKEHYFVNPFINKQEWSMSLWFKNNGSNDWSDVFTFSGSKFRLEVCESNASYNFYYDNASYGRPLLAQQGTYGKTTGVWMNVIITFNKGQCAAYFDGFKVQSSSAGGTAFTPESDKLYLGSRIGGNYSNMSYNDLRCYDHCLSAKEIKDINKALVCQYDFGNHAVNLAVKSRTKSYSPGFNGASSTCTGSSGWVSNATTWNSLNVCKWYPGAYSSSTVGPYFNTSSLLGATLEVGKTYTISVYLKADVNVNLNINYLSEGQTGVSASNDKLVTTTWKRFWRTFTAKSTSYNACVYAAVASSGASGYMYACGWKIEEGNLSTAYTDESSYVNVRNSNGYHTATASNCITISDGRVGDVALRTKSSGYVTIPAIYLDNDFTICGWFNCHAINAWARIFDFGTATEGAGYDIGLATSDASGSLRLFGRTGGGAALPDTTVSTISANTWYHFAIAYRGNWDDNIIYFYLNGKLITSFKTTNKLSKVRYLYNYIGKSNWSADPYSDKLIDDFRIYNNFLYDTDIEAIYKEKMRLADNMHLSVNQLDEVTSQKVNLTNKSKLMANALVENKYLMLEDRSVFMKIFEQHISGSSGLFSDNTQAQDSLSRLNKYSRLNLIPKLLSTSNKYEFLLTYPKNNQVPDDYEELEYIEFDSGALIDLGLKATGTTRVQTKIMPTNPTTSTNMSVYCSRSSTNSNTFAFIFVDGYVRHDYNTTQNSLSGRPNVNGQIYEIDDNQGTLNITVNGNTSINSIASASFTAGENMIIGASNANGIANYYKGRIYYFRMSVGGIMQRDLIPVRHRYTSLFGMYDVLNKKFYPTSGNANSCNLKVIAGPVLPYTFKYNRWKQSANPLAVTANNTQTASTMGYEAIRIDWPRNWLYGMGLSSSTSAYLDCEAGHNNWWYAIGEKALYGSGMPGCEEKTVNDVILYARIDNTNYKKNVEFKNNIVIVDTFNEKL